MFGVAKRVAMKALRSEYRRLRLLHGLVWDRQAGLAESTSISEEMRNTVARELQELPEIQRTVIEKCVFAGESYRDVGEELKLPLATVASHLRRGRKTLRARLVARGIGAVGLAAIMTALSRAAAPPESLCRATAESATALLAGDLASLPVRIVSLMKGVAIKMPVTAKCLLAVWLSLGTGASTWWAVHGTKDHEVNSSVKVAIDAGPILQAELILNVDVPGGPQAFPTAGPTIEFVAEPSVR
jgi:hypothetical protein